MNEISDYELLYMIRQHNEEAYLLMYERYLPLMWQRCYEVAKRFHQLIQAEDLISDCMIVFNQTLYTYRFDQDAIYSTYLYNSIEYRLCSLIRANERELKEPMMSFEEHEYYLSMLPDTSRRYEPECWFDYLNTQEVLRLALRECSTNERIVMEELLAGYREIDVVRKWNISRRRVEYLRKKFQKRFSKMLYLTDRNGL